jgi:hypothetical protein
MLVLSRSQAKNYFKKLIPSFHNEGCDCCSSRTDYEIKGNRILCISSGEHMGSRHFSVKILAKVKQKVEK